MSFLGRPARSAIWGSRFPRHGSALAAWAAIRIVLAPGLAGAEGPPGGGVLRDLPRPSSLAEDAGYVFGFFSGRFGLELRATALCRGRGACPYVDSLCRDRRGGEEEGTGAWVGRRVAAAIVYGAHQAAAAFWLLGYPLRVLRRPARWPLFDSNLVPPHDRRLGDMRSG